MMKFLVGMAGIWIEAYLITHLPNVWWAGALIISIPVAVMIYILDSKD